MNEANKHQWRVFIQKRAQKTLTRLPTNQVSRIDHAIRSLALDPRPHSCKKLKGFDDLYRIRIGDWRIIYAVRDKSLIILVVDISSRGDAYRRL